MIAPTAPQRVGQYVFPRERWAWGGLAVSGRLAFVGTQGGGFEVIDVSNPFQPQRLGQLYIGGISDVSVAGDYAYLTCPSSSSPGLRVIDFGNPTQPQVLGEFRTTGQPLGVAVAGTQGDRVYVAAAIDGLAILNAYQPPLRLNTPVISATAVTLSWTGGPGIRLQRTVSLTTPDWQDVPGSDGAGQIELAHDAPAAFFRLVKP